MFWLTPAALAWIFAVGGEKPASSVSSAEPDPAFRRVMMYLFVGMRGGQNRARIAELLKTEPSNANKIALTLSLDYKTVRHHLRLLEENGVIVASGTDVYGAVYFLTAYFDRYYQAIRKMWAGFGQI